MYLYKTVSGYGEAEESIKKSKFTARVSPVESYEEAREFVDAVKEKYRDATHDVPTIVVGNKQETQWTSDDGEPQGTAGAPVLHLAVDEGLTNIVIVVTRYFGGIKLGPGGLLRAYSGIAKKGIEAAGICGVRESIKLSYDFDYPFLSKFQRAADDGLFKIGNIGYSDRISMDLSADAEKTAEIQRLFQDITSGKAKLTSSGKGKIKIKIS